jgi:hypothetical protein
MRYNSTANRPVLQKTILRLCGTLQWKKTLRHGAPGVRPIRRGGRERAFEELHAAGVGHVPSLPQKIAIADLVRQSVLEGILTVGKELCLV